MMWLVLALIVVTTVAVTVAVRRRDHTRPLVEPFLGVAERRGWKRLPVDEATAALTPFDRYLGGEGGVDVAVGGDSDTGYVTVAAVGIRDRIARGRPWYVAAVSSPALDIPAIDLDPRSVRTVRVVATGTEVVVDDARIARGWRVTSADPRAAAVLDSPPVRIPLSEALHRPMPFLVGVTTRPGAVAVHLAGPDAAPNDTDDLDRLTRLVLEVADALAAAPA